MNRSEKCPKCGDNRIAGPHNVWGGDGHVKLDLPGMYTATLVSFTCANCGYTELYSDRIGLDNIRRDGRFVLNRDWQEPTYCARCGAKLRPGDSMCYECGERVE